MEYRDFVEQVKEQIQDFLPEKFADAAVEVNQIVKNNDCVLDGLMVRTEEGNASKSRWNALSNQKPLQSRRQ